MKVLKIKEWLELKKFAADPAKALMDMLNEEIRKEVLSEASQNQIMIDEYNRKWKYNI